LISGLITVLKLNNLANNTDLNIPSIPPKKKRKNKWNIPEYSLLSFTIYFLDLEEIILEFNFNISENNTIRLELAKVLGYYYYYYLGAKIP
jgi:hypothetical protein